MADDGYTEPNLLKLRQMWLDRVFESTDERIEAERNFDDFFALMLQNTSGSKELSPADQAGQPEDEMPRSSIFLELILETEQAVAIIPARVAEYRSLLAAAKLDKAPVDPTADPDVLGTSSSSSIMAGSMAGINLADQAALAYHQILVQLCMQLAQAALEERLNSSDGPHGPDPRG